MEIITIPNNLKDAGTTSSFNSPISLHKRQTIDLSEKWWITISLIM